ncbi:C40 family peptidase [Lacisediminihabitans sp.]|uniref:C40 family peptidase n=1 Tax=Lacisediminihabitans sp. TaxID=2787631 RepID=UPI00374D3A00
MTELEPRGTSHELPAKLETPARQKNLSRLRHRGGPLKLVIIAVSTGLIATLAIPAYASNESADARNTAAVTEQLNFVHANAQTLNVTPAVAVGAVERDAYTATSAVKIAAAKATVKTVAATRGTAISPGLPSFSLDGIFAEGMKYVGTPYVYGGSTPAGFDCSGFVLFLYSHVGISLAHNARVQGQSGTVISQADARPGDLVIFYGGAHDGIYAGNNMVLDAPKPGGSVGVRAIWTSDVFFVRLGI